ncbi:PilZ domain-containing protein [Stakelama sp. CBK3Z-3]|uniref:PilZ domain-containing protein n=1 Tax=Stakelama flava TaxID=2860338 RepID=A0ABS6XP94_9SPHN|nr:PilZ domain-containing protein [Stakelama flava]
MTAQAQRHTASPEADFEQRATPRQRAFLARARMGTPGEPPSEAALLDISIYGCRLAIDTGEAHGASVEILLAGSNPIAATVIWNENGRIGCRFDEPIDRLLVRSLNLATG